jgi:hypothetical protein
MHTTLLQKIPKTKDSGDQNLAATTQTTTKIALEVRAHKTMPSTRSLQGTIN